MPRPDSELILDLVNLANDLRTIDPEQREGKAIVLPLEKAKAASATVAEAFTRIQALKDQFRHAHVAHMRGAVPELEKIIVTNMQ